MGQDIILNNVQEDVKILNMDEDIFHMVMKLSLDINLSYMVTYDLILSHYFPPCKGYITTARSHEKIYINRYEDDMLTPVFIIKILSSTDVMNIHDTGIGIIDEPVEVMDHYEVDVMEGIIINSLFWRHYKIERSESKLNIKIDQNSRNNFHDISSYRSLRNIVDGI